MAQAAGLCRKRVFSGIQPSGIPHLGNYFGAIAQWIKLSESREALITDININNNDTNTKNDNYGASSSSSSSSSSNSSNNKWVACETPIYCIVDVHAYTSTTRPTTAAARVDGSKFYDNILATAASLIALGLDTNKCILMRQSDLFEHNYLENVLQNFVSTQRLTHMTQFKEKSQEYQKSTPNGLLNYPVLQAADILLYRADLVPVGHDQLQHIELTRDIASKFNSTYNCQLFPQPQALLNTSASEHAIRVKSLRNASKKMSKSDKDARSYIQVVDEPDIIVDKCKKAITDSISAVYYEPSERAGVSNLLRIYHLVSGQPIEAICEQHSSLTTAQFKLRLAELLIERFAPVRSHFRRLRADRGHLEQLLAEGAARARPIAMDTISKVKHLLGSARLINGEDGDH